MKLKKPFTAKLNVIMLSLLLLGETQVDTVFLVGLDVLNNNEGAGLKLREDNT